METITIYGVGKYRDDKMTINKAEACWLIMKLTLALKDEYNSHVNIAMPTIIKNTES